MAASEDAVARDRVDDLCDRRAAVSRCLNAIVGFFRFTLARVCC